MLMCCNVDQLIHSCMLLTQKQTCLFFYSGGGLGRVFLGFAGGWFIGGKIHCRRMAKKLNAKHKQDQKQLYTQYYNDVYTLQEQNTELVKALEQMGVRAR